MLTKDQKKVDKAIKQEEKFFPLKQNATTNYLSRFSTKNKKEEFKSNNNIYEAVYGNTVLSIRYEINKKIPNFYVVCQKLIRYIMCKFTEKGFNSNVITLSVKEMLATLCLADNKRSRAGIRCALKALQDTTVDFAEKIRNKTISGSFNIIAGWKWNAGYLMVKISQTLINTLNEYGGFMTYPASNFKLSNRSILDFPINDRIAEFLFIGKGKKAISCQKLYECALEAGMQSYEHISKKSVRKSFTAAIVKPIENALNKGKFYKWKYRKREKHSTFNDWMDDYVEVAVENTFLLQLEDKEREEVV